MTWLLGPGPMAVIAMMWLFQGVAYMYRKDWGHATMSFAYAIATGGLIYTWFRP